MNLHGYGQISIEAVVRALGVPHVAVIQLTSEKEQSNPSRSLQFQRVSVVIAQEMCTLYAKGLKKPNPRLLCQHKCRNHRDCISQLACPAFYLKQKSKIDPSCAPDVRCAPDLSGNAIRP